MESKMLFRSPRCAKSKRWYKRPWARVFPSQVRNEYPITQGGDITARKHGTLRCLTYFDGGDVCATSSPNTPWEQNDGTDRLVQLPKGRESILFQIRIEILSIGAEGNDITAPSLAVEDRLCHSAARRALPTKSMPEGIWRGTSYYLVERSQHDAEARAEDRRGARRRLQRGMTSQRGNVQQVQSSASESTCRLRTIAQKEKRWRAELRAGRPAPARSSISHRRAIGSYMMRDKGIHLKPPTGSIDLSPGSTCRREVRPAAWRRRPSLAAPPQQPPRHASRHWRCCCCSLVAPSGTSSNPPVAGAA